MHIILAAIGRLKKNSPEYELMSEYLKRTKWSVEMKEYEEKKALSGEALKNLKSWYKDVQTEKLADNCYLVRQARSWIG